ncbi:TRAP transporter small permease [Paraliobacillus sediminis]|uniref:TRAP transporter small permease n=1 Tax=Paraliobacillus sediminis TaxID=1885916 RepID=UPI000E3D4548|nr:TRAP transporter small permease [Paraliobacillus sediminis]
MKYLNKVEEFLIASTLLIVTVVLFVNIVLRYGFSNNTSWAEEFIRYGMIWIAFIGSSVCFRKGMHVGVDFLSELLKGKVKKGLRLFVNLASMVFMVFLIKYSIDLVLFTQEMGQITPSLQIPLFYIYLAIPIGSALSLLHLTIQTVQIIRNKEKVETLAETIQD